MQETDIRSRARRALLLLAPAVLGARLLPAQSPLPGREPDAPDADEARLPNGKKQRDEILKADYEKNVKEARDLIELAKSFEEDLERDDRFILSMNSLKKLDNMESTIHRIRGRLKKL